MYTANSLRFCKFYGKIPAMRTLHAYYGIIQNNEIECVRFFIHHLWQQAWLPYAESRKVNRTVVIRINKPDKLNEMNCVRLIPVL